MIANAANTPNKITCAKSPFGGIWAADQTANAHPGWVAVSADGGDTSYGELCEQVYTIEIVEPLGRQSSALLAELGYERVNSWFIGSQYPSSTYLAGLTAVLVTAGPWMQRKWRWTGWIFIVIGVYFSLVYVFDVSLRGAA